MKRKHRIDSNQIGVSDQNVSALQMHYMNFRICNSFVMHRPNKIFGEESNHNVLWGPIRRSDSRREKCILKVTKWSKKFVEVLSMKFQMYVCNALVMHLSGGRRARRQKLFSSHESARFVDKSRYQFYSKRINIHRVMVV